MRLFRGVAIVVCTLGLVAGPAPAVEAAGPPAAGGVIVTFDDGVEPEGALRRLQARLGASGAHALPELGAHALGLPARRVPAALAALAAAPGVAHVEPDHAVELLGVAPDDPLWSRQWGPEKVGAVAGWEVSTGDPAVTIAVLDTGVNDHPDLDGALLSGRNILTGDRDTADRNGHGTMAAGVAAARGDNGIGVAGMCWRCRVLPVKVLDDDGNGSLSDAAAGIVWAADNGADVVSMSFGAESASRTMNEAVAYARDRGVVLVAAAGNAGKTDKTYPAAAEAVIGVAASTGSDGRYPWSNHGDWVDVAAPGCNEGTEHDGGYGEFCGTSSAAPIVAGLAGLARASDPSASAAAVRDALTGTATDVGDWVRFGRVDAAAALRAGASTSPSAPEPEPESDPDPEPESDPDPEPESDPDPDPEQEPDPEPVAGCAGAVPPAGFVDTAGNVHERPIDCVTWHGIARGVTADSYQPAAPVRRDQLATFLARLLAHAGVDLPEAGDQGFTDLDGNPHADAVNRLAAAGVVNGLSATTYGPGQPIRRDQMAALLHRAHQVVTGRTLGVEAVLFADLDGNVHRAAIEALAAAGIVAGKADGVYAPADEVRRDQMASFIARQLGLLAGGGSTEG